MYIVPQPPALTHRGQRPGSELGRAATLGQQLRACQARADVRSSRRSPVPLERAVRVRRQQITVAILV